LGGRFQSMATFGATDLTTAGNDVWARSAGGTVQDQGTRVLVDAAGNAYVSGTFDGTAYIGATTLVTDGVKDIYLWQIRP